MGIPIQTMRAHLVMDLATACVEVGAVLFPVTPIYYPALLLEVYIEQPTNDL